MPLPIPNLDDKTFEQLINEAKKLIPIYAPEWTDHNIHDPGITFVELLAWLTESELYRTNVISDKHKLKYLTLLGLGFRPHPPEPAKVDLTIEANGNRSLEKGEAVSTKKLDQQIFFELVQKMKVAPIKLEKVIVDEGTGVFDRTEANKNSDLFYPAFGLKVRKGCKLYLGFDQPSETFSFMCYLYEKDLIQPGKHGEEADYKFSNAKLKWKFCVSDKGDDWQEISTEDGIEDSEKNSKPLVDGTAGFKKSGRLLFEGIPKNSWKKSSAIPEWKGKEDEKYYWLCCEVIESHFEYPPRIETIRLNTVPAVHGKTITDDTDEREGDGLPHQVFELRDIGLDSI